MSAQSRNRTYSSSGRPSRRPTPQVQDYGNTMPSNKILRYFDPCAATASMFVYAQGSTVVCCHHDTLNIERRFSRHSEEVQLLAVDNQSDLGTGRLVVSFDAGQTAIVWDLMTGDEVSRFASYENLTAASWMKNGNVAFGNTQGSIIQYEPTTHEHISTRTLDQIAITALAPANDCRTFAIGYQNGSLLVATLQPRFTILHNLTTNRAPSPIVTLSWHASSSRQKSDMLAVQTQDGDLRVWSVAKSHNADDPAKIVRVLKKAESSGGGPNWMGWSKNGRIIQYSDHETLSWDVRTKHVTYDSIPTLEHVRGLAVFGPGASLFTLGPNNTVQQFDLNSPAIMVANVQHPAALLPPSPPVSIEEATAQSVVSATTINTSESESSIPFDVGISESDDDHLGPFARIERQHHGYGGYEDGRTYNSRGNEVYDTASELSSRSRISSVSKDSAGSKTPARYPASLRSRRTENTYISAGSSLRSSTVGKQQQNLDTYSMGYTIGTSVPSMASTRSRQRPSRLRNEVARSPAVAKEEKPSQDHHKVHDLFPFTRARLSDIPYKHPLAANYTRLTNDDLRRQMLSTVFGWNKSVEDLIRDEMSRHTQGSPSRILLAKWLGDIDADIMETSSENMTSSDWMLLALSGIGGQASQHKLGRAYIQRLLEGGDIHAAVTIMLGMGDHNDAVEIYISHKKYMEALILCCLAFPSVWERQCAIVKKWGEWAVQHGQQQLAIRCFACTDQESTEPWASPSATQLTFQSLDGSIPEVMSPPLSPPGIQRGPQRSVAKASALKLITSFGDVNQNDKFRSAIDDDGRTPMPAGPETAVEVKTPYIKTSAGNRFNTPTTARPVGGGFSRDRLPSIGEMPADLDRDDYAPSEPSNRSVRKRGHSRATSGSFDSMAAGISLQRAATAGPMMMRENSDFTEDSSDLPEPDTRIMMKMEDTQGENYNGSRNRIPQGVSLQLAALAQREDVTSPEPSAVSSARFHWPSRRRGPGSVASSVTSAASSVARSVRNRQAREARTREREDYIRSLDATQYSRREQSRHASRERSRGRHSSLDRSTRSRDVSEDRKYDQRKRSPTSPLPMSPEDLISLSTPRHSEMMEPATVRKGDSKVFRPSSRTSSRGRHRPPALDIQGNGRARDRSVGRSRSPQMPTTASTQHFDGSEDEEDLRAAMEAREKFRAKHSRSRGLPSPTLSRRERSSSRRARANSEAADVLAPLTFGGRAASTEHAGDLRKIKDERQRKKDMAARELEERRRSLAKRPQAPSIPHPDMFSPQFRIGVEAADPEPDEIQRCATEPPRSMYARGGPSVGLPATPKAMRLVIDSGPDKSSRPEVPRVPAGFSQRQSSPESPPRASFDRESANDQGGNLLTLLPSTVYQPPSRPMIPRSMSAPIPDDPSENFRQRRSKGGLQGIDEDGERRRSNEDPGPPPPPLHPSANVLQEFQHLAMPPPPPPAPLPIPGRQANGGALGSGMIEIVMNDDEGSDPEHGLEAPAQIIASNNHSRGRSIGGDTGSISGRISKATERLRSASRSRRDIRNMKSPNFEAPYESVPSMPMGLKSPPIMYNTEVPRPPMDSRSNMTTGLHKSELI